jgi:autotransporter-associated beta strand protein
MTTRTWIRKLFARKPRTIRRVRPVLIALEDRILLSTLYWDPGHTGGTGSGGAGTWDTSSLNWFNGTADVPWNNANGDSAVFAGSAGTVTLGTGITAGGLTFNSDGYTVTGNTLSLVGSPASLSVVSGVNATISANTSGGSVTKTGSGTLTLSGSGDNTNLGLTVNAGTVRLAKASSASPDVHAVSNLTLNSGTVQLAGTGDYQISQSSGVVAVNGGVFDFNGENQTRDPSQPFTLGNGALSNSNSGSPATLNAPVALVGNASIGGAGNLLLAGVISGSGALTQAGSGTTTLSGANSYSGGTSISGGVLQFNSPGAIGGSGANVTVNSGGTAAAGYAIDQAFLGRIVTTSAGVIALAHDSSNPLDFSASGANLAAASLGAVGSVTYSGTLTPNGTIYRLGGGGTLTVASALSGPDSLAVALNGTAAGTVVLTAANSYSGGTTISGGTLQLQNPTALGSSSALTSIAAGATLDLDGQSITESLAVAGAGVGGNGALINSNSGSPAALNGPVVLVGGASIGGAGALLLPGAISGNFALTKAGGGTTTLAGANSYSGGTSIISGTLQVGAGGTSGTLGSGAILDNGTLVFDRSDALTVSAAISGSGALTQAGSGTLTLSGANSYAGATFITAGTLRLGVASALPSNTAITVAAGATLDLNNNNATIGSLAGAGLVKLGSGTLTTGGDNTSTTFSGIIRGTGGLTKPGTGTLCLAGANTYSGDTDILAGTLKLQNAAALRGTAMVNISPSATLDLNGYDIAAPLNVSNGGRVINSKSNSTSTVHGQVAVASGNTRVGGNGNMILAGVLSGVGGLLVTGGGIVALAAASTYLGGTTLEAGTKVVVENALSLGFGPVTFADTGGLLDLNGQSISNPVTVSQHEVLTFSGLINSNTAQPASLTGPLTLLGDVDIAGAGALSLFGLLSGVGGLTMSGTGILTLAPRLGPNTYTGTTTINGGLIQLGAAGALPSSASVIAGGSQGYGVTKLDLNGFDADIGQLGGIGNVSLGNATLTVGSTGNSQFNGKIIGAGSVTKVGNTTLTLNSVSTYEGPTAINAGTILLGRGFGGGALPAGTALTIAQGATFDLNNYNATIGSLAGVGNVTLGSGTLTAGGANTSTTFSGVLSGTGGLTKAGDGTLILSGANTYTGATTINAGTLQIASLTALPNGTAVTLANGAILDLSGLPAGTVDTISSLSGNGFVITPDRGMLTIATGGDPTFSGIISGTGGVTYENPATLILSGANTYTGPTIIDAGTVQLGAANALPGGSAVTVAAGATLDLNNFDDTIGALAGAGTVTLGSATLTAGGDNTSTTFSGVLSGTGGLTKAGAGTLTLAGANTYTGATTIDAGTLLVGAANALPSGSAVIVAAGATLDLNNFDDTIGSLAGAGNVTLGFGNLTTGGDNTSTMFSGVLSGFYNGYSGLTKAGTGTLTLSGANTYTGHTDILAGTLQLGAANALPSGSRNTLVAAGATLDLNNYNATVGTLDGAGNIDLGSGTLTAVGSGDLFSGVISGTGGLIYAGIGNALRLSGDNTYSGGTSIISGTLQVGFGGTSGTLGSGPILILDNGTLMFSRSDALTVSAAISGSGGLVQTGGTITLTAANNAVGTVHVFFGGLIIAAGSTLTVGTFAVGQGGLTIAAGGTLSVAGDFDNEGSVTLGASGAGAGIITVGGNYTQSSGAMLTVQLAGTPASGRFGQLIVTGTANLAGTLTVQLNGYTPVSGDSFQILTDALVNGDFGTENLAGGTWDPNAGTVTF